MDAELRRKLLTFQRNEITEHHIYRGLAQVADRKNAGTLRELSDDELKHYGEWKEHTGRDVRPDRLRVWWYSLLARVLGLTFAVKLMESGEEGAQEAYSEVAETLPEAREIVEDELRHEELLVEMIDEERVRHVGSMVLGINDALVEITGTLAGLTLALGSSQLVGLAGLITGISATLSMGASEYLSQRSEGTGHPLRAAGYTASAYLLAVTMLVTPYFLLAEPLAALGLALFNALLLIVAFTYFTSVVRDQPFRRGFMEMAGISFGVAGFSFLVGLAARRFLGVE